jgi:hypothetical protein
LNYRVGEEGQRGVVEISDLMFSTKGSTSGAVLMRWNIHEDFQGSAAMWDVVFRVGGAKGSDLTVQECPWIRSFPRDRQNPGSATDKCMASSLMLHVTQKSSIYMENMWFWVAGKLKLKLMI